MCGIAGLVGRFAPGTAERMAAALRHRGPDGEGIFEDEAAGLTLVHRRLAIIDLGETGRQPMTDSSGRFVITYNGELYNSADLRRELEQRGCAFRGRSDTEVLVELLARDGMDALARLNGIFAFALWDKAERSLLLVRDPLGVKPLYWATIAEGFAFASEIKALLPIASLGRDIDPVAAAAYLTYLWSPGERTMLRSVRKLAPGGWMKVAASGKSTVGRYYRLPDPTPEPMRDEEAIAGTRERLRAAVERQMMSDVEIGAFLSGGLDSTSIVHFARELSGKPIRCFTASYDGATDRHGEHVTDLPFARAAARKLGCSLHEVSLDDRVADEFPQMIAALDEPQGDLAALLNMKIAEAAHAQGIKVLLSGAGGDDVFSGYRRHVAARFDPLIDSVPHGMRSAAALLGRGFRSVSATPLRRAARFFESFDAEAEARLLSRIEWTPAESAAAMVREAGDPGEVRRPVLDALAELGDAHPLERSLRIDQLFFLPDHNLNYTDKTGMAHSVEIRVPLLDVDLIDWAARLPVPAKVRGSTAKWALRKAMQPVLPREIVHRPKTGFGVPVRSWVRGLMRPMMEELLSRQSIEARGILDPCAVESFKNATLAGRVDGAYTLIGLMAVELWARTFLDSPIAAQDVGPTSAKRGIATSKAVPSSSTIR